MQVFYEVRVSLWETCGINMVELVPWGAISLWFIWGSWIWSIKLLNRVWWEAFLTDEGGGCVFGYDGTKHLYTVYETERKHAVVATEDFASHVPSASMTKWKCVYLLMPMNTMASSIVLCNGYSCRDLGRAHETPALLHVRHNTKP